MKKIIISLSFLDNILVIPLFLLLL